MNIKYLIHRRAKLLIENSPRLLSIFSYLSHKNLDRLASIHKSDKFGSHFYTQHYNKHFKQFKWKKLKLLEIGIGGDENVLAGGSSLKMWKYYFPRGSIYGIDIHDKSHCNEKRIKTYKADQSNQTQITRILNNIGSLDIIIDDGSHINNHVINTFKQLFPKLKIGGIYVIEDTQTSYWPEYGGTSNNLNDNKTIMGFFKSLVDGLNYEEIPGRRSKEYYFDQLIKEIHFYHNLIFIHKGLNNEGSNTIKN